LAWACSTVEHQIDQLFGQTVIDGPTGEQRPDVQRRDQGLQQQPRVEVGPQIAAFDPPCQRRRQGVESARPEGLAFLRVGLVHR
jgi:hypothetical protein